MKFGIRIPQTGDQQRFATRNGGVAYRRDDGTVPEDAVFTGQEVYDRVRSRVGDGEIVALTQATRTISVSEWRLLG